MDKNFIRQDTVDDRFVQWYDARDLELYGVFFDGSVFRRMSGDIAKTVNDGVHNYSAYSAGGRVRFSTDSPFVALKADYGPSYLATVNNHCVSYGFDLYRMEGDTEVFTAAARPVAGFDRKHGEYKMLTRNNSQMTSYTLNLPAFSAVKELKIGIEFGAAIAPGISYRNDLPVVYYGSSITHGAAAGRPGNTYESFISQKYNLDYINLGFSGSARGEQTMAEYLSELPMSVFVCDYDHNAPNIEHLQESHFAFYETFRKKQPYIPYIMISRPTFFVNPEVNAKRRQVIYESYRKALELGDQRVFFIDGETLMQGEFMESCTSDGIHPNDLGFFRMAQKIGPIVNHACEIMGY